MAISFDGANRRIVLSSGTVALSVRDLWSRWVDWTLTGDNSKYLPAMAQVGGNPIDPGSGTSIPIYAFLLNGWRVRPQEASHTLNVSDGVLLVDGGGDPFINTVGSFIVRINYQQPVQAITVASGGGGGAPTAEQNAAAAWAYLLEGVPAEQAIAVIRAGILGKTTGIGTPTERYRSAADDKDRIVATFDSAGNRIAVVADGS